MLTIVSNAFTLTSGVGGYKAVLRRCHLGIVLEACGASKTVTAVLDWEIHRASLHRVGRLSLLKVFRFPDRTTGSRPSDGIRMIASRVLPYPQAYRGRIAGKKFPMVARLWLPLLHRANRVQE